MYSPLSTIEVKVLMPERQWRELAPLRFKSAPLLMSPVCFFSL
jgi:hypothetical protein